jgi:plasmid stability protein
VVTIQIRDVPDDVHEELQRRAREAGQSLQAYMREQITSSARSRSRWSEAVAEWEAYLAANPPTVTRQQILDDLDDDRGR